MKTIVFEVPGKPQGKARARTFYNKRAGKTMSITPEGTVNYENLIKVMFLQSRPEQFKLITTPVAVHIIAHYRKAKANKMPAPMLKPDADNICKCVLDALNGVAYQDDKQVIDVRIGKRWAEQDEKMTVSVQYSE